MSYDSALFDKKPEKRPALIPFKRPRGCNFPGRGSNYGVQVALRYAHVLRGGPSSHQKSFTAFRGMNESRIWTTTQVRHQRNYDGNASVENVAYSPGPVIDRSFLWGSYVVHLGVARGYVALILRLSCVSLHNLRCPGLKNYLHGGA